MDHNETSVWEMLAHIQWGHHFHVCNDVAWMVCSNCEAYIPNDGQFSYPYRCPYFWDGETLREPPERDRLRWWQRLYIELKRQGTW